MRRASITVPDGLSLALEKYHKDLEVPPSLAAVVQVALEEYLEERGYPVENGGAFEDEQEIIPAEGPEPRGLADAPRPRGGETRSPMP